MRPLIYEIEMLAATALRLARLNQADSPEDQVGKNAFLETMLVHARCLISFLRQTSDRRDIHATHFVPDFRLLDAAAKAADDRFEAISKHLSHLSWERARPDWTAEDWLPSVADDVVAWLGEYHAALVAKGHTTARPFGAALSTANATLAKRKPMPSQTAYTTSPTTVTVASSTFARKEM